MLDYAPRLLKLIGARGEELGLPDVLLTQLAGLDYTTLEIVVCKLLARIGYHDIQILGRTAYYGKSLIGGADLAGRVAAGMGRDHTLVQIKQYTRERVRVRMVDELRGACLRGGATHGVLITTGRFVPAALRSARQGGLPKVICIDGPMLAELCITHHLGVEERAITALVLDSAFFSAPTVN